MITTFAKFHHAWAALLARLYYEGRPAVPRDQPTCELLGVAFTVADLRQNVLVSDARKLSYRFMVAEWLWIAAGREDVRTISRYNKNIGEFSDDGERFAGAYGPRLTLQEPYLLDSLRKKDSRQAVAVIWSPNPRPSKDLPCTTTLQMFNREGKLHGIVTMRSSDIWLGLPYDFFNFSQIVSGFAGHLDLEPGSLTYQLGSSHLYDRDRAGAEGVFQDHSTRTLRSPRLPYLPDAGRVLDLADPEVVSGYAPSTWGSRTPWLGYLQTLRAETNREALYKLEEMHELDPLDRP